MLDLEYEGEVHSMNFVVKSPSRMEGHYFFLSHAEHVIIFGHDHKFSKIIWTAAPAPIHVPIKSS